MKIIAFLIAVFILCAVNVFAQFLLRDNAPPVQQQIGDEPVFERR